MKHTDSSQKENMSFQSLGVAPKLLEALAKIGCITPTPIQQQAIPTAIQGKDIVGIAQTGTGKTFAFGIPMIQRLAQIKGQGLIVLPTRELALQVDEALQQIGKDFGLRTVVLIGGVSSWHQSKALARNPHLIIATPGRLLDHVQQKTARLNDVRIVVLDEADRMFDMGFAPQIRRIFGVLPNERQTLLFSATMPPEIMKLAAAYMQLPIRVEVAPAGTPSERVTQEIFVVHKNDKNRLLDKLLAQYQGTTLVFTRTKFGAKKLVRAIRSMNHTVAEIHSNRSLSQRREALDGFKTGRYRVLVATDIASRGIDVADIGLVVNYDLPTNSEDYVHRIGRTARAGASGHAISFATPEQRWELRSIERLIRKALPISKLPELPPSRPEVKDFGYDRPDYSNRPQRPDFHSRRRSPWQHRRPYRR